MKDKAPRFGKSQLKQWDQREKIEKIERSIAQTDENLVALIETLEKRIKNLEVFIEKQIIPKMSCFFL